MNGAINTTVDLPPSATATFLATVAIDPASTGTLENTVDVALTGAGVDPEISNNSATDSDPVEATDLLWGDGFETGDTSLWSNVTGFVKSLGTSTVQGFGDMVVAPRTNRDEGN